MNPDDYLKSRVDDQIAWYSRKGRNNQRWSHALRVIEVIAAALIPFIAGMGEAIPASAWLLGTLGVAVAICAGAGAIFRHHENWISFRATAEALKQEKYRFLTGAAPYGTDAAFDTLVQRVEGLIAGETAGWAEAARSAGAKPPAT